MGPTALQVSHHVRAHHHAPRGILRVSYSLHRTFLPLFFFSPLRPHSLSLSLNSKTNENSRQILSLISSGIVSSLLFSLCFSLFLCALSINTIIERRKLLSELNPGYNFFIFSYFLLFSADHGLLLCSVH